MALTDKENLRIADPPCGCVPQLKCSKCSTLLCVHVFRTHKCNTKIDRNRPLR